MKPDIAVSWVVSFSGEGIRWCRGWQPADPPSDAGPGGGGERGRRGNAGTVRADGRPALGTGAGEGWWNPQCSAENVREGFPQAVPSGQKQLLRAEALLTGAREGFVLCPCGPSRDEPPVH